MLIKSAVIGNRFIVRGYLSQLRATVTVVFTNGCFDVLHPGHVECLKWAKAQGDILVVGLNSDESVRRLKGPRRPIMSQEERAIVLSSIRYVDAVSIFDEDTPEELIRVVRPDVLVKGSEYVDKPVAGREFVEGLGGRMAYFDMVPGQSTSSMLDRIRGSLRVDELIDELDERRGG